MRLIYFGCHVAVTVPLPLGGTITIKRGEVKNFPDSLAKELLKQKHNWKKKGAK